jgi:ribosomal subunit interface protein
MEVVVLSRRIDLPEELRDSAERKTQRLNRYLGMERAEVCFSNTTVGRLGDPVSCEIVLEGHGHVVRAVGTGGRAANALDAALEKAALQLTRLKRKLVGRSRPRHGEAKDSAVPASLDNGASLDEVDEADEPDEPEEDDDLEGITEL